MLFGPEDRRIGGGVISAGNCPGNRVRHTIPLKDRVSNDSTLFFKGGERAAVCLIVLAWKASPKTRLAVAVNRDEFFARRTAPAAWWADAPDVLAGRDLEAGGTWLGVTRAGRFAALTNFRDASAPKKDGAPSRGALAAEFLRGDATAAHYVAAVQPRASRYHGFTVLVSDGAELWSFSNVEGDPERLGPGVWGLSNHLLETPWPKVTTARSRLEAALGVTDGAESLERRLLSLLEDRTAAPDGALPATGLPPDWERALSAAFVELPIYGTRASTALVIATDGTVRFAERSFGKAGALLEEVREVFEVSARPRG
jgi:uncharacterized protein with NRDE domain